MKLTIPRTTTREKTPQIGLNSTRKDSSSFSRPRKRKSPQPVTKSHRYITRLQVKESLSINAEAPRQRSPSPSVSESEPPFEFIHFPKTKVTVAFSDGDYDLAAILPRSEDNHSTSSTSSEADSEDDKITHVIRLSHLSARVPRRGFQRKYPPKVRHCYRNGLAWSDYDVRSGVATLDLVIPRKLSGTTRLTESQLKLAQSFLDLVFLWPTDPPGFPDHLKPRIPNPFHIFITAPKSTSQHRASSDARTVLESADSMLPVVQDASLSQASRDILALIGDRIDSHSDIDTEEGLLFLEENSRNNS